MSSAAVMRRAGLRRVWRSTLRAKEGCSAAQNRVSRYRPKSWKHGLHADPQRRRCIPCMVWLIARFMTSFGLAGRPLYGRDSPLRSRFYGVRRLDAVLDYVSSGLTRSLAQCAPLTAETRTQAIENGVEPPYSISQSS